MAIVNHNEPGVSEDTAKRFAELTTKWKEETRFTSKIKTMRENSAYREIIAMSELAIPLLLADLEKNGGFGFLALGDITGANPVPKESAGKIDEMAAAWLVWGRTHGYRW